MVFMMYTELKHDCSFMIALDDDDEEDDLASATTTHETNNGDKRRQKCGKYGYG